MVEYLLLKSIFFTYWENISFDRLIVYKQIWKRNKTKNDSKAYSLYFYKSSTIEFIWLPSPSRKWPACYSIRERTMYLVIYFC